MRRIKTLLFISLFLFFPQLLRGAEYRCGRNYWEQRNQESWQRVDLKKQKKNTERSARKWGLLKGSVPKDSGDNLELHHFGVIDGNFSGQAAPQKLHASPRFRLITSNIYNFKPAVELGSGGSIESERIRKVLEFLSLYSGDVIAIQEIMGLETNPRAMDRFVVELNTHLEKNGSSVRYQAVTFNKSPHGTNVEHEQGVLLRVDVPLRYEWREYMYSHVPESLGKGSRSPIALIIYQEREGVMVPKLQILMTHLSSPANLNLANLEFIKTKRQAEFKYLLKVASILKRENPDIPLAILGDFNGDVEIRSFISTANFSGSQGAATVSNQVIADQIFFEGAFEKLMEQSFVFNPRMGQRFSDHNPVILDLQRHLLLQDSP